MAWSLLRIFPKELLNRISPKIIEEFYHRKPAKIVEKKTVSMSPDEAANSFVE
jgi:V-type H+-transporting ATPase subunit B